MTEKTPIPHLRIVGTDRSKQSHQVSAFSFFTQHNVKISRQGLLQVPRKGFLATLAQAALSCPVFVSDLCEVGFEDVVGGGTNFECYEDGPFDPSIIAGKGISALYVGDGPFGTWFIEDFEPYPDGAYGGGEAAGAGFGTVYVGNGPGF